MHELGIAFHISDSVEKIAKENNVKAVSRVTLEVGEVSTVIPDYLTDVWNWNRKRTQYLKECELEIEIIKAVTYCEDCKKEYPTVEFGRICPYCKSEKTYLVTGNEINIKEIEVEDENENEDKDKSTS